MTLIVQDANMDFGLGRDLEYLEWLITNEGGTHVLLLQECTNVHVQGLVAILIAEKRIAADWHVIQHTGGLTRKGRPRDKARAGSALLYRSSKAELIGEPRQLLGSTRYAHVRRAGRLVVRGFRIRTRWFWVATLRDVATTGEGDFIPAHWPPGRFRPLQPGFTRRVHRAITGRRAVVMGVDANQQVRRVARQLGLTPWGRGIVGILATPGLVRDRAGVRIRYWGVQHHATDHPSVRAPIELPVPAHRKAAA